MKRLVESGALFIPALAFLLSLPANGADVELDRDRVETIAQGYKYNRGLIKTCEMEVLRHHYYVSIPAVEPVPSVEGMLKYLDRVTSHVLSETDGDSLLAAKKLNIALEEKLGTAHRVPQVVIQRRDEIRIHALYAEVKTPTVPQGLFSMVSSGGISSTVNFLNRTVDVYPHSDFSYDGMSFYLLGLKERFFDLTDPRTRIVGFKRLLRGEVLVCLETRLASTGRKVRETWIDVERGYFPRRVVEYLENGDIRFLGETNFLIKTKDGHWFPTYVIQVDRGTARPSTTIRTSEVRSVEFNQRMPSELFSADFVPRDFSHMDNSVDPPRPYSSEVGLIIDSAYWSNVESRVKSILQKWEGDKGKEKR